MKRLMKAGDAWLGSKSSNIRKHVETHLDGLSYNCNVCNKEFRSGKAFYNHKSTSIHKNNIFINFHKGIRYHKSNKKIYNQAV